MMFYTYAYLRKDGSPYYIGKGKGKRVFEKHSKTAKRPNDKSRIVFLDKNLTEEQAHQLEKDYISILGRKDNGTGILRNLTNGGEGTSGIIMSEETRNRMANSKFGNKNSLGRKHPPEIIKKISEAGLGRKLTEETRNRMSISQKKRRALEKV